MVKEQARLETLNQGFFNRPETVSEYARYSVGLTPPEGEILERIRTQVRPETLLDLGIGAGRTVEAFASATKNYLGVDYAPEMVAHCKNRFQGLPHARFETADARSLLGIEDQTQDVVLFSFNGIDCIPIEERNQAFKSIYRVLRKGGVFVFSTHNLASIPDLYSWHFTLRPLGFYWEVLRNLYIRRFNPPLASLLGEEIISLRDGVHRFQISVVYTRKEAQLKVLEGVGFSPIEVMSPPVAKDSAVREPPWFYFWCEKH